MSRVNILSVGIDRLTKQEALSKVETMVKSGGQHYIVTPNPEFIIQAQKDQEFAQILNKADLVIPDGIGLIWASRFLYGRKKGLPERVAGVDLMEDICRLSSDQNWSAFFLGAQDGVAAKAAEEIQKKYPIKVLGTYSGWAGRDFDKENQTIIKDKIGQRHCQFIFVAYGSGKQEKWIERNLAQIPVDIAMGVGGSFDFLSGKIKRAPGLVRKIGLEWLWRLIKEPWRFKRQLSLPKFVYLVFLEKIRVNKKGEN